MGVSSTIILTCLFSLHPSPQILCLPLSGSSPIAELNANVFMGLYIYCLEFLSSPKFGSRALTYLLYPVLKGYSYSKYPLQKQKMP